jgi:hypothetical protein
VNILNKQSLTADKGWSSILEVGQRLTIPHHKETPCCKMLYRALELDGFFGMTQAAESGCEVWNIVC